VSPLVAVQEVAQGGYEVVIRLPAGGDRRKAAELAQEIRDRQFVDLRDPRWGR
jgi:hypothetical protein